MDEAAFGSASPRVDAHAHIFTRAMPFASDAHSRPGYDYPVDAYLADLDRREIGHGVIAAASLFADDNAYTLSALAAHGDRLRATVLLPADTNEAALDRLVSLGVVGVRLQWRRRDAFPDLTADPWRGFLRRLADRAMHVELLAAGAALPELLPRFAASGVPLVIDHFGVPSHDAAERQAGTDAVLRAIDGGKAWVKVSAGFRIPLAIAEECTARFLAGAGPGRLLWGSDAPFVNHEDVMDFDGAIALYHRLVPDPRTRGAIDATALQFYFNQKGT